MASLTIDIPFPLLRVAVSKHETGHARCMFVEMRLTGHFGKLPIQFSGRNGFCGMVRNQFTVEQDRSGTTASKKSGFGRMNTSTCAWMGRTQGIGFPYSHCWYVNDAHVAACKRVQEQFSCGSDRKKRNDEHKKSGIAIRSKDAENIHNPGQINLGPLRLWGAVPRPPTSSPLVSSAYELRPLFA